MPVARAARRGGTAAGTDATQPSRSQRRCARPFQQAPGLTGTRSRKAQDELGPTTPPEATDAFLFRAAVLSHREKGGEKGDSHQIWVNLTANDAWPGDTRPRDGRPGDRKNVTQALNRGRHPQGFRPRRRFWSFGDNSAPCQKRPHVCRSGRRFSTCGIHDRVYFPCRLSSCTPFRAGHRPVARHLKLGLRPSNTQGPPHGLASACDRSSRAGPSR